jgi:hypothetical protein
MQKKNENQCSEKYRMLRLIDKLNVMTNFPAPPFYEL